MLACVCTCLCGPDYVWRHVEWVLFRSALSLCAAYMCVRVCVDSDTYDTAMVNNIIPLCVCVSCHAMPCYAMSFPMLSSKGPS